MTDCLSFPVLICLFVGRLRYKGLCFFFSTALQKSSAAFLYLADEFVFAPDGQLDGVAVSEGDVEEREEAFLVSNNVLDFKYTVAFVTEVEGMGTENELGGRDDQFASDGIPAFVEISFVLNEFRERVISHRLISFNISTFGRDGVTRTRDPYVPNVVRYQLRHIPMPRKKLCEP